MMLLNQKSQALLVPTLRRYSPRFKHRPLQNISLQRQTLGAILRQTACNRPYRLQAKEIKISYWTLPEDTESSQRPLTKLPLHPNFSKTTRRQKYCLGGSPDF